MFSLDLVSFWRYFNSLVYWLQDGCKKDYMFIHTHKETWGTSVRDLCIECGQAACALRSVGSALAERFPTRLFNYSKRDSSGCFKRTSTSNSSSRIFWMRRLEINNHESWLHHLFMFILHFLSFGVYILPSSFCCGPPKPTPARATVSRLWWLPKPQRRKPNMLGKSFKWWQMIQGSMSLSKITDKSKISFRHFIYQFSVAITNNFKIRSHNQRVMAGFCICQS